MIEENDISVNMEELIHPKVFAEFATQKFKLILADLANLADDYLIICLIRKILREIFLRNLFLQKSIPTLSCNLSQFVASLKP